VEHLHTDIKTNQQAKNDSLKKSPVLFVFILCMFIMAIIIITTVLLGNSLSKFVDKENNTIALALAENTTAQSGYNNTGNDGLPEGYYGDLQAYDNDKTWTTKTYVDLFKDSYDGTVKSDKKDKNTDKRIAPGTSNYYDFTVKNNGNIPLDYSISLEVGTFFDGKSIDSEIPVEWRLLSADKEIITDWQNFNGRSEVLKEGTLDLRNRDSYTIEWRWIFERGQEMDIEDTELGNLSVDEAIGVNATIYVYAEQSADWDGKTSILPHTGDNFNPVVYLLLLVAAVCGLLILVVVYKRRKKDEGIQNDQK